MLHGIQGKFLRLVWQRAVRIDMDTAPRRLMVLGTRVQQTLVYDIRGAVKLRAQHEVRAHHTRKPRWTRTSGVCRENLDRTAPPTQAANRD
jgi:hypothetical protein